MIFKKLNSFIFLIVIFYHTEIYAKEINIYSHRQPFLINPFLEIFTNETGIKRYTNISFIEFFIFLILIINCKRSLLKNSSLSLSSRIQFS